MRALGSFAKFVTPLCLLVVTLLGTGCVGPLMHHEPARSVGQGQDEIAAGYGSAGYIFKWTHGFTKDFDAGVHFESLSLGIRAKYAIVNNQTGGWSFATALGYGDAIGGNYTHLDIMGSYLTKKWEPYSTVRLVHMKIDAQEIKDEDEDTDLFEFETEETSYMYGEFILGSRYWFSETWALSIELATLFAITDELDFSDGAIASIAATNKF